MPEQLPGRETPIDNGINVRRDRGIRTFVKEVAPGLQWLGPGEPLKPVAPPQVQIRRLDCPVGYDYAIQPRAYELVSFPQLQALADNYDLLRIAIEIRKRLAGRKGPRPHQLNGIAGWSRTALGSGGRS